MRTFCRSRRHRPRPGSRERNAAPRLLAVAHDVEAGLFLALDRERGGVFLASCSGAPVGRSTAPTARWAWRARRVWAGLPAAWSRTSYPPDTVFIVVMPSAGLGSSGGSTGEGAGCAPMQRAEGAAARTPSARSRDGAAGRAAPRLVGWRVGGARQPVMHLGLVGLCALSTSAIRRQTRTVGLVPPAASR